MQETCIIVQEDYTINIKNTYFKDLLKSASKNYKSRITQSVKTFKSQRVEKLRNLKSTNPKEFWKIINSVDKKNTHTPPLDELHNFFKNFKYM